jgi:endonuclease YncB( thermonuclease family)
MPSTKLLAFTLLCALGLNCSSGATDTFTARVVGVGDGDTITVLRNRAEVRVRIHGIDCPELHQAFGRKAKEFTSRMVFGHDVQVALVTTDKYDRIVGRVSVDGRGLGLELVRAGLAWHFTRYSNDSILATAEREARAARRGLWADDNPVPPWEYRPTRPRR